MAGRRLLEKGPLDSSAADIVSISAAKRLRALGLHPRKGLGQHFLMSQGAVRRILDAADLGHGQTVVEVGPGLGVLTQALAETGAQVIAVELDRELAAALGQSFQRHGEKVNILCGDAKTQDPAQLAPGSTPYKLVANLPYNIGTAIVRRFLESERRPQRMVVMLQREVARSMVGAPGKMGLLAVGVHFYGRPSIVATVLPGSFYPPPRVVSAIVRIDAAPEPLLPRSQEAGFFSLVRAGFSAPRKQLRGVLSHALARPPREVEGLLCRADIDPSRRAETLSMREWVALHAAHQEHAWTP